MAIKKQPAKGTQNQRKSLYKVHCTECGDEIENKFFPLANVLDQYYYGEEIAYEKAQMISMLGIGAIYGGPVLPWIEPLIVKGEEEDNYIFQNPKKETIRAIRSQLKTFSCADNELPADQLVRTELNISSIVMQFCLSSNFGKIYKMLHLQMQIEERMTVGEDTMELQAKLDELCVQMSQLPCIHLDAMSNQQMNNQAICQVLSSILKFARAEAEQPEKRHFCIEEDLLLGWRYKVVNDREMPFSLVGLGTTTQKRFDCTECCCDKCYSRIPYEFGAYKQVIVGVLGTQATGKTTYLMALTDAIERNEATSVNQSNCEQQKTKLLINHALANDAWWERVGRVPGADGSSDMGVLWLYQHGFPPQKTNVAAHEAPALSFLVKRTEETAAREPEMFTLADIPGEAFYDTVVNKYPHQLILTLTKLLRSADALIMVINSQQMRSRVDDQQSNLVGDANAVLASYKNFLPAKPVPTAVVMTASDKINCGDLRQPLHLAYDIRKIKPLIWSERAGTLVYNAGAMQGAVRAVKEYLNFNFGMFIDHMESILKGKSDQDVTLAAFAVSNGTQCAPLSYVAAKSSSEVDADYFSEAQMHLRAEQIRAARFGITAPLLWLLACRGMLETGCAENEYNAYTGTLQRAIDKNLAESLYD